MELMRENIDLNQAQPTCKQSDEEDLDQEPHSLPTLSAKTLDWDAPLPDWVIANHPDIIM